MFEKPENHITAVPSVLAFAANLANFQPASKPAKSLVTTLILLSKGRLLSPGFITDSWTDTTIELNGSFTQLEKEIRGAGDHFTHWTLVSHLSTDKTHTVFIPEQTAKLVIVDFHANGASLTANAATLSKMIPDIVSPRDAVDLFTSPKVIEDTTTDLWAFLRENSFSLEAYDWQVVLNWKK
ncbi:hypothetical protein EMPS_06244 [Entomortierella parvispora]|uniref:Uncharacterized protein n=1 Tax=Entomortierella parvispora TaxID=205924 RepID=A0A9P3LX15_9FUNG|nr:hypothetical protein EMPS_06244 [Entomortierella parvispora]